MTDLIVRSLAPAITLVSLDRPDARNAYSVAMIDALCTALDAAEDDDAIRCVILTGEGSSFSAGGDLKLMRDRQGMFAGDPTTLRTQYMRHIHRVPRRLARFDKPIIAAINGPAVGAGLDLACMCDVRIASDRAKLGSTFVSVGLVPGDGGAYLLARTIGFPRALEMIMSSRMVSPDEALHMGLVSRVVPHEKLLDEALTMAQMFTKQPPQALRLAKRAAYAAWDSDLHAALETAATYQAIAQNTPEHAERVQALIASARPSKP
jgi:2-(1,2-epoxy-1,2-dihydrophenyl)acetyl-CoA isomerase